MWEMRNISLCNPENPELSPATQMMLPEIESLLLLIIDPWKPWIIFNQINFIL